MLALPDAVVVVVAEAAGQLGQLLRAIGDLLDRAIVDDAQAILQAARPPVHITPATRDRAQAL